MHFNNTNPHGLRRSPAARTRVRGAATELPLLARVDGLEPQSMTCQQRVGRPSF